MPTLVPMPTPPRIERGTQPTIGERIRAAATSFLIWACFVLPGVVWLRHDPVELTYRETANVESTSDLWLGFIDAEYALPALFNAAPSLVVDYGLVRDATSETVEEAHEAVLEAEATGIDLLDALAGLRWQEDLLTLRPRLPAAGRLDYKLDPSFGFENKELKLRGLMIRVWVDF